MDIDLTCQFLNDFAPCDRLERRIVGLQAIQLMKRIGPSSSLLCCQCSSAPPYVVHFEIQTEIWSRVCTRYFFERGDNKIGCINFRLKNVYARAAIEIALRNLVNLFCCDDHFQS